MDNTTNTEEAETPYFLAALGAKITASLKDTHGTTPTIRIRTAQVQEQPYDQGYEQPYSPTYPPQADTAANPGENVSRELRRQHPQSPLGLDTTAIPRAEQRYQQENRRTQQRVENHIGHWLLSDGAYTGHVKDHAGSAAQVLDSLGRKPQADPMYDVMNLSGAVRVRYIGNKMFMVDIAAKPSKEQQAKIVQKASDVERAGGMFTYSVLGRGDMSELASGSSVEEFLDTDWDRLFSRARAH